MIDRERFEQLAALAVAHEATPAERTELETALARDPALAAEFAALRRTDDQLRRAARRKAAAEPPPGPVLSMLDEARRAALSARQAAEATAAGAPNVTAFQPAKAPGRGLSMWLTLAACGLVLAGLVYVFLPAKSGSKDIAVFAPRGATGFTQPRLVWDAQPGQKYNVWILPPGSDVNARALYIAKDVLPPVAFASLKPGPALEGQPASQGLAPGQEYRVLVCLAGADRLAGTAYSFRTAPDAAAAAPPIGLEAAQKLAADGRPADALAALAELPAEQRERPEARDLEAQLRAQILSSPPP